MRIVIHHAVTGKIVRQVTCHPDEAALQPVPDGHAALILPDDHAPIDDRRHKVQAGAIVDAPRCGGKKEALAASAATRIGTD